MNAEMAQDGDVTASAAVERDEKQIINTPDVAEEAQEQQKIELNDFNACSMGQPSTPSNPITPPGPSLRPTAPVHTPDKSPSISPLSEVTGLSSDMELQVVITPNKAEAPEPEVSSRLRSSRRRIVPTKCEDMSSPVSDKKVRTPTAKRQKQDTWAEDYLLQNPKSRLVQADLLPLFTHPRAVNRFAKEDKQELSQLVPPHVLVYPDGEGKAANVDPNFLKYDMDFRHGLRCFAEDLRDGRFDPVWLQQAAEAMEERAHGDFDDFKAKQFELFWGQKQEPPDSARGTRPQ